jgi:hypothetical protein
MYSAEQRRHRYTARRSVPVGHSWSRYVVPPILRSSPPRYSACTRFYSRLRPLPTLSKSWHPNPYLNLETYSIDNVANYRNRHPNPSLKALSISDGAVKILVALQFGLIKVFPLPQAIECINHPSLVGGGQLSKDPTLSL